LEAEYLPFDKALLASDDSCGRSKSCCDCRRLASLLASDDFCCHSTPDKVFEWGILAGLSHGPQRARCCDYAPMWPCANGVEL
jgi:hypothetical protein